MIIIISSRSINLLSLFYYINADQNNYYYYHHYYYHYHLDYAASSTFSIAKKSFTVIIPKGSSNPEVDITKLGPRQWYLPRQITIHTNDTIGKTMIQKLTLLQVVLVLELKVC
jgi:hypothetical protein